MLGVTETQAGNLNQARDAFEQAPCIKNEKEPSW